MTDLDLEQDLAEEVRRVPPEAADAVHHPGRGVDEAGPAAEQPVPPRTQVEDVEERQPQNPYL